MIGAAAAFALLATLHVAPSPADSFPHAVHRRLFVTCRSCHAGIVTGDSATGRPAPGACAACHDGRVESLVTWSPAPPRPSNLRFDHVRHFREAPDSAANETSCRGCHAASAGTPFMEVSRAGPEACFSCHEHRAESHLAESNRCSACHRPVTTAARLAASTIERFPRPPSHDSGFVFAHGEIAPRSQTCQVCHSRDFCASCHVNAGSLEPIQALGEDVRIARLMEGKAPVYRAPASHDASGFLRGHGLLARRNPLNCGNCHSQESCVACHTGSPLVSVIALLPRRVAGGAPGVDLAESRPPGHQVPDFRIRHREVAAGGDATCSRCHQQTFCASCHDAARRPGFHASNFVTRHASPAVTPSSECSSCHQVQVFCRDCHRQTGTAPVGRTGSAGRFHNRQPAWLFSHGAVARRSLESCVSCHQQNFCLQCHSASTGWKVNPHGSGFRPAMGDRNPAMCRICHTQGAPGR